MAEAAADNQLAGDATPIVLTSGQTTTVAAFLEQTYGYTAGMAWASIGILLAFIAAFRLVSAWAVAKLSFQSR